MNYLQKAFVTGALVLALAGCKEKYADTYVNAEIIGASDILILKEKDSIFGHSHTERQGYILRLRTQEGNIYTAEVVWDEKRGPKKEDFKLGEEIKISNRSLEKFRGLEKTLKNTDILLAE